MHGRRRACAHAGSASAGVAGYRIVVEAGGDAYIYHTDFDRIIPCVEP
ncbi:MAG: hypothetical protein IPM16_12400 [Chloroflexi bacterium]|nr:hypothetical protein [Chloroflexota bacterium]